MLDPLMLRHKKDEVHVKMLCDILIEKFPGLKNSLLKLSDQIVKRVHQTKLVLLFHPRYFHYVQSMLKIMCAEICLTYHQKKKGRNIG